MSSAVFKTDLLMFGDLLAHLRQQGLRIGVDHYLRLHQLLDKVGDHCAPGELRTLLCPIFATSKTQQEQFYKTFDSYFELFQIADKPIETGESFIETAQTQALAFKSKSSRQKLIYAATPVAFAALIFALVLFLKPKTIEQPAPTQAQNEANDNAPHESDIVTTSQVQVVKISEAPTPPPEQSFYERHRTSVQLAIILSPLILFLLYEWYRFTRRKLLLQKQQARKPPLVWPIRVDAPEAGLYDSEQFLTAARLLRRRQTDGHRRLDVEATVAATVECLGFPDFRYKSDSRVPEYLVLIDRASYRDHQARLFDEMTQALEREGVFVSRYFFDSDPRVCRDESGAGVAQLTELQNRYGNHRLLIFGNGEKLLNQITGRLDGWTAIFNHWQDRALLTVETPARWGLHEIALAQLFIVLPATLNGLLALVDHFETTLPADLRSLVHGDFETPALEATPEEIVAALRRTLGEDAFQWLAACAVYTELQWNLTLLIGSLPSMPTGLVTEANLLKLIRLSWFRTGIIPDELRWLLINELAPERQKAVRAALIEILEKDPAPPETFANDYYRLNLFAQRWLQSRTRKRLRELMRLVKQLPRSQIVRDLTLIRFLESAKRSPLDFLLPDRLRKLFYHRGIPAFGLRTGARLLVALLLMGVAWGGIKALSPVAPNVVKNETQATEAPDVGKNVDEFPVEPSKEQNQNSNNDNQSLPPVAKDQKQKSPSNTSNQRSEAVAPNMNSTQVSKTFPMPSRTGLDNKSSSPSNTIPIFGSVNNTSSTNSAPTQGEPTTVAKGQQQQSLPNTSTPGVGTAASKDFLGAYANDWALPGGWSFSSGKLKVNGNGMALPSDSNYRNYKDFQLTTDVRMMNGVAASFAVHAIDSQNYYLIQITGPNADEPYVLRGYLVRNGSAQRFGRTTPISQFSDTLKPGKHFRVVLTMIGSETSVKVLDSETGDLFKLGTLPDPSNAFPIGAVGIAARGSEQNEFASFIICSADSMRLKKCGD